MSSDSEITSRLAERTADDALAIFNLLVLMHEEVGRHPLSHQKAFREICLCIEHGAAYMVYRGEELVASSGFRQAVPWYSDETVFSDQWFYVRKDCRGDSRALRALIKEAQGLAKDTGELVQFKLYDPDRPSRSKSTTIAEDFCFKPIGKVHVTTPVSNE